MLDWIKKHNIKPNNSIDWSIEKAEDSDKSNSINSPYIIGLLNELMNNWNEDQGRPLEKSYLEELAKKISVSFHITPAG